MIKIEDLTKVFPDGTKAVNGVSLEVPEGELLLLVGPSGCGKTTTMKMINRLIPATSGKIYIDGQDIMEADPVELRRSIGYVIQEIGLFPHMTVAQNIGTVPSLMGWSKKRIRERAEELLDLMGMDANHYIDVYPKALSGGQKQRVGVARAMATDPPIMLMDEPFGAIDPITRERLQDEFLNIQETIRKTIVFVTHDINEAIKMGNKIGLMKEGKMVQSDTPTNLLTKPKNDFVRDFVGADRTLKSLRLVKVSQVMDRAPQIVSLESRKKAEEKMKDEDLSVLALVDENNHFKALIRREDPKKILTDSFIEPEAPLHDALSLMLELGVDYLCVVHKNKEVIGLLNFKQIRSGLYGDEEKGLREGREVTI